MSHYERYRDYVTNPQDFFDSIQVEKRDAPGSPRLDIIYQAESLRALDEVIKAEADNLDKLGDILDKLDDIKEVLNQIEINTRK